MTNIIYNLGCVVMNVRGEYSPTIAYCPWTSEDLADQGNVYSLVSGEVHGTARR